MFPIDINGFAEGFVSFRSLCGIYLAAARFARNRGLECGPLSGQLDRERNPMSV